MSEQVYFLRAYGQRRESGVDTPPLDIPFGWLTTRVPDREYKGGVAVVGAVLSVCFCLKDECHPIRHDVYLQGERVLSSSGHMSNIDRLVELMLPSLLLGMCRDLAEDRDTKFSKMLETLNTGIRISHEELLENLEAVSGDLQEAAVAEM